jgi:hypothetical protein
MTNPMLAGVCVWLLGVVAQRVTLHVDWHGSGLVASKVTARAPDR